MASKRVRSTAFGVGTLRALEGHVPPRIRLFDDPIAERLLTGAPAVFVRYRPLRWALARLMNRVAPGFLGGVLCRTRAIDDACREALAAGAEQVVILGAGMDTRPYRMAEMSPVRVWELDLPEVQQVKKAALVRVLGRLPAQVRYLPMDLAGPGMSDALTRSGFDPAERTLLIFEAVSPYLPRAAVEEIFGFAATLPPGSRLAFTYMPQSVIDGTRYARAVRRFEWQTGFQPEALAGHLATHGLTLLADLGAEEHQEFLLRPRDRVLEVFEIERVAIAETSVDPSI